MPMELEGEVVPGGPGWTPPTTPSDNETLEALYDAAVAAALPDGIVRAVDPRIRTEEVEARVHIRRQNLEHIP